MGIVTVLHHINELGITPQSAGALLVCVLVLQLRTSKKRAFCFEALETCMDTLPSLLFAWS